MVPRPAEVRSNQEALCVGQSVGLGSGTQQQHSKSFCTSPPFPLHACLGPHNPQPCTLKKQQGTAPITKCRTAKFSRSTRECFKAQVHTHIGPPKATYDCKTKDLLRPQESQLRAYCAGIAVAQAWATYDPEVGSCRQTSAQWVNVQKPAAMQRALHLYTRGHPFHCRSTALLHPFYACFRPLFAISACSCSPCSMPLPRLSHSPCTSSPQCCTRCIPVLRLDYIFVSCRLGQFMRFAPFCTRFPLLSRSTFVMHVFYTPSAALLHPFYPVEPHSAGGARAHPSTAGLHSFERPSPTLNRFVAAQQCLVLHPSGRSTTVWDRG